jgi:hypothetical protein
MDLEDLSHAMFAARVGEPFAITGPATLELSLEEANLGAEPPDAGRRPFSLIFRGPQRPLLAQQIYRMEHEALGALEIFIVPVSCDASGARYEAVFS